MTNKITLAIDLMTEYLEEGYDAELIGRLNKQELASLIVCPVYWWAANQQEQEYNGGYSDVPFHIEQIVHLAKEAFIELCLQEMMQDESH